MHGIINTVRQELNTSPFFQKSLIKDKFLLRVQGAWGGQWTLFLKTFVFTFFDVHIKAICRCIFIEITVLMSFSFRKVF